MADPADSGRGPAGRRKWAPIAVLLVGVALLLVFVGNRIGDRTQIAEAGRTVLMPLVPLGTRDLSLGDQIVLVYDLPDIEAELRAGNRPAEGTLHVILDDAGVVAGAEFDDSPATADSRVTIAYRYAASGLGLWPSDRPRLIFGDGYFLVTEGSIAAYLGARYAVLKADEAGRSVVTGLADANAELIEPAP